MNLDTKASQKIWHWQDRPFRNHQPVNVSASQPTEVLNLEAEQPEISRSAKASWLAEVDWARS